MDDESSTMKRRSRLLLIFWVTVQLSVTLGVTVGISRVREVQAQSEAPAAARPTQRSTRQQLDDETTKRFMGRPPCDGRRGGEIATDGPARGLVRARFCATTANSVVAAANV